MNQKKCKKGGGWVLKLNILAKIRHIRFYPERADALQDIDL